MTIASLRSAQDALGAPVRNSRDPKKVHNDAFRHVTNPRLRFHRFLPCQDHDDARRVFLDSFEGIDAAALSSYASHYRRVQAVLAERGARCVDYPTASRLALGLGDETVTEIGIRLHHTFGVPVIPGSAQKGLCARYAASVFKLGEDKRAAVFGAGGTTGRAGAVAFHDALWKPEGRPFLVDVIAVHHPAYYQEGTAPPGEWDSPSPLTYLTARGTFTFAIEGEPRAVAFASRVLRLALDDWGIGARTSKGYGRFQTGVDRPAAKTKAPSAAALPEERTVDGVRVEFLAGPDTFAMRLATAHRERRAEVKARSHGLFESQALLDAAKARAKKKGFVTCRVTYRVDGNQTVVVRLVPDLPPAGGS